MPGRIADISLDHVAVAVERWPDAWPRYAVDLGGTWSSGGLNVGFGPAQLRFANGGRVEVLQPWMPEQNPFLRRFLDRHGPAPHHLTFKVPDLVTAIDRSRQAGFDPIGINLRDPGWKEAFLHPHRATGIVVQLAQAAHGWESPAPEGFPTKRRSPAAALLRVTHAVADLDAGLALFAELLGGTVRGRGDGPGGAWRFVDLSWSEPPALRLVAPVDGGERHPVLGDWLGNLPGRARHLVFAATGLPGELGHPATPDTEPGLAPTDGAASVVEPADNNGTRLVLLDGAPADDDGGGPGRRRPGWRGRGAAGRRAGPLH